jgi:hypothetical protein
VSLKTASLQEPKGETERDHEFHRRDSVYSGSRRSIVDDRDDNHVVDGASGFGSRDDPIGREIYTFSLEHGDRVLAITVISRERRRT